MILRRIKQFYIVSIMFLSLNSVGMEISSVKNVVEASGYLYSEESSGIKKLPSGSYVLRVFLDVKDGLLKKSVIVVVNDNSVIPIDAPVWSGDSVQIQVLDINSDGEVDIVVNEYYEPSFNVRVFFNGGMMTFSKVLQQDSASLPEFVDLGKYFGVIGSVKEIILTKDPYQSRYDPLFCSKLYAFNGKNYQKAETGVRTHNAHKDQEAQERGQVAQCTHG